MAKYLAEAFSVSNLSSEEYAVTKLIGHAGSTGYIVSDGGEVFVQVAESGDAAVARMKATLNKGEVMKFEKADGWEITKVKVSTDSATAISGRIFLR